MSLAQLSDEEREKLAGAMRVEFGRPVTGYLTHAVLVAVCCLGVVYHHIHGSKSGRFQDGHRIRTSDVVGAQQYGEYWALCTHSGSLYVVVTFAEDGLASLDRHLALRRQGMHGTPRGLH
jgi:hypothetical protein